MMHKSWCGIEEVPYCFLRSSIRFQGHTGQKIKDLNPIWTRLLGRWQLSNPSDLPCWAYNPNRVKKTQFICEILLIQSSCNFTLAQQLICDLIGLLSHLLLEIVAVVGRYKLFRPNARDPPRTRLNTTTSQFSLPSTGDPCIIHKKWTRPVRMQTQ